MYLESEKKLAHQEIYFTVFLNIFRSPDQLRIPSAPLRVATET
jgi:hypothetical protein